MMRRMVLMHFRKDEVSTYISLFEKNRGHIASFPGCNHLDLLRDKEDSGTFVTYSIWESEEALENYRKSELFQGVWSQTKVLFSAAPQAWSLDKAWGSGS